jgi:hypothetical protein
LTSPRSLPTSPCELSEREVTSPSNLKVVGALDNYSLVFVIFINFFGQLKDWVGQVLFLVSCPKGQVEKYVNVEAWKPLYKSLHQSFFYSFITILPSESGVTLPLQHDFPLDPMISSFHIHFRTFVTWLRENYDYRNVSWEMICI